MITNEAYNKLLNFTSENIKKKEIQTSKTFKLSKRITNRIDESDAIEQAIKKIIFTDRYRYKIYSSNYGIDLDQFIGKDLSYIEVVLPEEIERALKYDDRVLSIKNLRLFKTSSDSVFCIFDAITIFGTIKIKGEF